MEPPKRKNWRHFALPRARFYQVLTGIVVLAVIISIAAGVIYVVRNAEVSEVLPPIEDQERSYVYLKTTVTLWADVENFTLTVVEYEQIRIARDGWTKTFRMGGSGLPASNMAVNNYCSWIASSEQYPEADTASDCRINIVGDNRTQAIVSYDGLYQGLRLHTKVGVDIFAGDSWTGVFLPPFPAYVTLFIQEKAYDYGTPYVWSGWYVIADDVEDCYEWQRQVWEVLSDPTTQFYRCHPVEIS